MANGNTAILTRYGRTLNEGATAAEALAEMQKKVKGTAEATLDPMKLLQNNLSDMSETIGGALIGDADNFIGKLNEIILQAIDWIKKNEDLVRTIGAIGLVLIGAGGVIFAIKQVSQTIVALNTALAIMQGLSGPKGWITLAAGVAAAGGAIWGINELMKQGTSTNVPGMASGGIVTSPTLAMIGERGPEAVIPLGQISGTGNQQINLYIDGEQVTSVIEKRMNNSIRLQEVPAY
jgi:hypothetical protein